MAFEVKSGHAVNRVFEPDIGRSAVRAVCARVVLVLMLGYLFSMLDRVSVGMAALEMNTSLGFSPLVFSTGAGLFFVGYALFEVPSVLAGRSVGARRWLCRCIVTFGLLTMATAWVSTPLAFYIVRFLTGTAEAGFYPVALFYVSSWVPLEARGKANALFIFGATLAHIVGLPASGLLLTLDGAWHLSGWQWLFIVEGAATVLTGVITAFCLADDIDKAGWLSGSEKSWLLERLRQDETSNHDIQASSIITVLASGRTWLFGFALAGLLAAFYGSLLWFPQLIKEFGFSSLQIGFIAATPSLIAAGVMFYWGAHSDRTGERAWHAALPLFAAGLAAVACALPHLGVFSLFTAILLVYTGLLITMPVFWAMIPDHIEKRELAPAFALISSVGNLGGFAGTYVMGWAKSLSGSTPMAFGAVSVFPVIGGVILLGLHYGRRQVERVSDATV